MFAKENNLPMNTQGWGHIHLGPWIRFERSKRYYYFFFKRNTGYLSYLSRWVKSRIGNHEIKYESKTLDENSPGATHCFSEFQDKRDYFGGLRGNEAFLRDELINSLRPKYQTAVADLESYPIGMHVRRGDFVVAGCPLTSEDYFVSVANKLRSKVGEDEEIRIFSDSEPEKLPKLLALPNVRMAEPKPDLIELFEISKARIIVTSLGSTFGYWAAFLSDADIILSEDHEFGKLRCDEKFSNRFEGTIDDFLMFRETSE